MARTGRSSPEVRERAERMVLEHANEHASQWAVITSIAEKIGCAAETLRSWVRQAERNAGKRPGAAVADWQRSATRAGGWVILAVGVGAPRWIMRDMPPE